MFTIEEINELHARLGSARTLPEYVRALKALGVERYDSYLADGHSEYFGQGGHRVVSPPVHEVLSGDLAAGGRAHRRGCVCDQHEEVGERVQAEGPREAVTDKGYHSNDTLQALAEAEVRTYISEPDRGRRRWRDKLEAQQAVYGNRRRICGERGKELLGVGNCWNGASRTPMKRGDAAS